ncbi:MAG TPA: ubiquinol-cytochrome c reductase iron-sulfur subunit [Acidobacteriota bacterium]|nr:ubiquinol-cytochrome c reductase iron-sulfur subunit [Acidobacteriota bacterium]
METKTTRRSFLDRLWKVLGIAAAGEFLSVAMVYLWPRKKGEEREALVQAGPVAEFTPASVTAFPASRFYLVRLQDGGFLALSSTCSHLGCTVPWNEKDQTFPCPCHASVFSMTGEVQSPPAPRALDLHPVTIESGVVKVDIGKTIRRQHFDAAQVTYL